MTESDLKIETDRVRVTEWRLPPGDQTGGWCGVSVVSRPVATVKGWRFFPPGKEERVPQDRMQALAWTVRNAIWESLKDEAQLASHPSPDPRVMQRMVVTLSLEAAALAKVKESALGQVNKEGIKEKYPQLIISFAGARFSGGGKESPPSFRWMTASTGTPRGSRNLGGLLDEGQDRIVEEARLCLPGAPGI